MITAFVLAAEILEGLTVGRGRRAIQDMLGFLPQTASVLREDRIIEVETKTIRPGEVVVIRPGGRIPVDGRVVSGRSFVEQAAITGEPMPSEKTTGSEVYAGTINQAGTLQVRAERLGKETTFGKRLGTRPAYPPTLPAPRRVAFGHAPSTRSFPCDFPTRNQKPQPHRPIGVRP